ncbi:MAG TPA: DUF3888 domain-containing protein [Bacillales bacterium]|nr:DUF3888 domain-containing protein [Bacillales bacterium]
MKTFTLAIAFIFIVGTTFPISGYANEENLNFQPKPSTELLYSDIFVSMLLPKIQKRVNQYYSKIFTEAPVVYPYYVFVENAKRIHGFRSFVFEVTFKVIPVVGPHIDVGVDRLVFEISTGNIGLKDFDHLKTEKLPPNWQYILK